MKILALDISTTTTGFAVMNSKLKLIEYGQFSIKDRTLSDTMYASGIEKKVIKLATKYKLSDSIIEDVYCGKNVKSLKTWCRVHGAVGVAWYKKYKKEPVFMMAMVARRKIGIKGNSKKIEIQLEVSKIYDLVKSDCYTKYITKYQTLVKNKDNEYARIEKEIKKKSEQTLAKKKANGRCKYQIDKLSKQFEEETGGVSEHICDAIVLALAYFKSSQN